MSPRPALPDSATPCPLPLAELLGRVTLAQVDVAQRLFFLSSRLTLGLVESYWRKHIQRGDETFYAADRAEIDDRVALLMEAGSEGIVTILRACIEDFTQAQICCVESSLRPAGEGEAVAGLLPFVLPCPLPGVGSGRAALRVSAGE